MYKSKAYAASATSPLRSTTISIWLLSSLGKRMAVEEQHARWYSGSRVDGLEGQGRLQALF